MKKTAKAPINRKNLIFISITLLIIVLISVIAVSGFGAKSSVEPNGIRIYLSPSNQYDNIYAAGNTNEMEQCDKIASLTAEELEKLGYTVMVGKSGDSIQNRCSESDAFNADMHVPIHTNALNGEYTGGTFVFVYSDEQKAAAKSLFDSLAPVSVGQNDRIEYRPDLYEIYTPDALSVYIECEFHDTKRGAEWIINNTDRAAKAIASGIDNYYSDIENKQAQ